MNINELGVSEDLYYVDAMHIVLYKYNILI